eukprot:232730-Rhodomonas_salina.1
MSMAEKASRDFSRQSGNVLDHLQRRAENGVEFLKQDSVVWDALFDFGDRVDQKLLADHRADRLEQQPRLDAVDGQQQLRFPVKTRLSDSTQGQHEQPSGSQQRHHGAKARHERGGLRSAPKEMLDGVSELAFSQTRCITTYVRIFIARPCQPHQKRQKKMLKEVSKLKTRMETKDHSKTSDRSNRRT